MSLVFQDSTCFEITCWCAKSQRGPWPPRCRDVWPFGRPLGSWSNKKWWFFFTDLAHEEWIWVFRFVSENEVLAFKYTNPVQITPYDFGPGFWFIALWRLISVYGGSSYLNSNLSFFNGGPGGPVRVDYLEIFQKIMKPGCWIFSEKRRPSSDLQQAPGTPGALHSPGHRLKNGEEISSRMPVVQNTAFLVSTRFNHI